LRTKFILASFNAVDYFALKSHPLLVDSEFSFFQENAGFFINEKYKTGIPQRIVWEGNLGIVLHGIVFPKNTSLDDFADNPDPILKAILAKHQNAPHNIPYEFDNGSYVGFVIDKNHHSFYAFTSFLNSIPLYYSLLENQLFVSTDLNRLSKICGKMIIEATNGLLEYYHLGTNLSAETVVSGIRAVPKGAFIRFDGELLRWEYYYVMPNADKANSFNQIVDEFAYLWEENLKAIDSNAFKFGLGFTGGIDSRMILAGWPDKTRLIMFTGGQPLHPDYLIADRITRKLGIKSNHHLEDYRQSDKLRGFKDMLFLSDNPSLITSVYFMDQFKFRETLGFQFELLGLTEYLGGTYHYKSRASLKSTIEMTLPLKTNIIRHTTINDFFVLIKLGLREDVYSEVLGLLSNNQKLSYEHYIADMVQLVNRQIISDHTVETYLEQFRHIHKMANLLTWSRLPGRNYTERLSPSMNIELTDFTARIPLKHRENRKILLAYLKRYHPELSNFVLTGSVFNANTPWLFHKLLNPYIKVLNAKGFKIPYLQWYIQKGKLFNALQNTKQFTCFQKSICEDSDFLKNTIFWPLYQNYNDHPKRLWRIFNIALLEKRINSNDQGYGDFLDNHFERSK
jgi:hypothetical protein